MRRRMIAVHALLLLGIISCGKVQDKMLDINPDYIAKKFLETWQAEDWNALYDITHPAFIMRLRLQKLDAKQRQMSDRELFVSEFSRMQTANPGMVLRSHEILSISPYRPGDTTLWVEARVNGKKRKIPLTLDGLSLKVDLARIE